MSTNYLDVGLLFGRDVGVFESSDSGSSFTLTANAGSFTISGVAANLTKSLSLTAATGAYTLSGQAATLTKGPRLIANTGSYTISGQVAVLTSSRKLTANAGAYVLSGKDATLSKSSGVFTLVADPGAYTISGKAAVFAVNLKLLAATGTYTISGRSADLRLGSGIVVGGTHLKGELFKPKHTADTYPKRYPASHEKQIQHSASILSSMGGRARAESLTAKQRTTIATNAAKARWR